MFEQGSPVNCQPLAFWSFADCFAYLDKHGVPAHPLHEQVLLFVNHRCELGRANLNATCLSSATRGPRCELMSTMRPCMAIPA